MQKTQILTSSRKIPDFRGTKFIRLQLILLSNGKWELFVELINGYHWKSNTDLC